jgi:hypothetical protein
LKHFCTRWASKWIRKNLFTSRRGLSVCPRSECVFEVGVCVRGGLVPLLIEAVCLGLLPPASSARRCSKASFREGRVTLKFTDVRCSLFIQNHPIMPDARPLSNVFRCLFGRIYALLARQICHQPGQQAAGQPWPAWPLASLEPGAWNLEPSSCALYG